jgi:hypothetical protein
MSELLSAIKTIQKYFKNSGADEFTLTSNDCMTSPQLVVERGDNREDVVNPDWNDGVYEALLKSTLPSKSSFNLGDKFSIEDLDELVELDSDFENFDEDATLTLAYMSKDPSYPNKLVGANGFGCCFSDSVLLDALKYGYLEKVENVENKAGVGDQFEIVDISRLKDLDTDFNALGENGAVLDVVVYQPAALYTYRLRSRTTNQKQLFSERVMQAALKQGWLKRVVKVVAEVPQLKVGDKVLIVNPEECTGGLSNFNAGEIVVVNRLDESSIPYRLQGVDYSNWVALARFEDAYRKGAVKVIIKGEETSLSGKTAVIEGKEYTLVLK